MKTQSKVVLFCLVLLSIALAGGVLLLQAPDKSILQEIQNTDEAVSISENILLEEGQRIPRRTVIIAPGGEPLTEISSKNATSSNGVASIDVDELEAAFSVGTGTIEIRDNSGVLEFSEDGAIWTPFYAIPYTEALTYTVGEGVTTGYVYLSFAEDDTFRYNADTDTLEFWNGVVWGEVGSGSGGGVSGKAPVEINPIGLSVADYNGLPAVGQADATANPLPFVVESGTAWKGTSQKSVTLGILFYDSSTETITINYYDNTGTPQTEDITRDNSTEWEYSMVSISNIRFNEDHTSGADIEVSSANNSALYLNVVLIEDTSNGAVAKWPKGISNAYYDSDLDGRPDVAEGLDDGTNSATAAEVETHIDAVTGNPHSVTASEVGLGDVTNDAQLKRAANDFNTFSEETSTEGTDRFLLEDGTTGSKEYLQASNLNDPDAIHTNQSAEITALTSKSQLTGMDVLLIEDSEASDAKKYTFIGNLPGYYANTVDSLSLKQRISVVSPSDADVEVSQGMYALYESDGAATPIEFKISESGDSAWRGVTDKNVTVSLTYWDNGTENINIDGYNSSGTVQKTISRTNSLTWKTSNVVFDGATKLRFNGEFTSGADLKISSATSASLALHQLDVTNDDTEAIASFLAERWVSQDALLMGVSKNTLLNSFLSYTTDNLSLKQLFLGFVDGLGDTSGIDSGSSSGYIHSPGQIISGSTVEEFNYTLTGDDSNSNYTTRYRIPNSQITSGGDWVIVTFQAGTSKALDIDQAWIGVSTAGGNAWDFDGNQKQLLFSGSTEAIVLAGATLQSDFLTFTVPTDTDVIVSFESSDAGSGYGSATGVGGTSYYKNTVGEAHLTAPTGYTPVSDTVYGVKALHVVAAGNTVIVTEGHERQNEPDIGFTFVHYTPVDAVIPGTDLKLYQSLDDGGSWEEFVTLTTTTLADSSVVVDTEQTFLASGDETTRLKIETYNNKDLAIHGWGHVFDPSKEGIFTSAISLQEQETPPSYESGRGKLYVVEAQEDTTTKLLMHSNTSHGSTTFIDSSLSGHTITPTGDTQHSTAQQKFGTTSVAFDGDGDYLTIPDHADWDFGDGNFTIDYWVYMTSIPSASHAFISDIGSSGLTTRLAIAWRTNSPQKYLGHILGSIVSTPTSGSWIHVALVRNAGTLTYYENGSPITSAADATNYNNLELFKLGDRAIHTAPENYVNGFIDEFRVSNVARWTGAFTPDTSPYDNLVAQSLIFLREDGNVIELTGQALGANYTGCQRDSIIIPITESTVLTDECQNENILLVDGAYTLTLPAVSGLSGYLLCTIYADGANVVTVAPNASDRIRLPNDVNADGVSISSSGTDGESLTLFKDSADGWSSVSTQGTWN